MDDLRNLDVVGTNFGDYVVVSDFEGASSHLLNTIAPVVDLNRNRFILGKLPSTIYQRLGRCDRAFIDEILSMFDNNLGFNLPNFFMPHDFEVQGNSLSSLLEDGMLSEQFDRYTKKIQERFGKNIETYLVDFKFSYMWALFGQAVLGHVDGYFYFDKDEKDECNSCDGFVLNQDKILFYSDGTMENNGHGPYRIVEYDIVSRNNIIGSKLENDIGQSPYF